MAKNGCKPDGTNVRNIYKDYAYLYKANTWCINSIQIIIQDIGYLCKCMTILELPFPMKIRFRLKGEGFERPPGVSGKTLIG